MSERQFDIASIRTGQQPHLVAVMPTALDVMDLSATAARASARLRDYALSQVLDAVGRVSACLFNGGPIDDRLQKHLCHAIMGDRAPGILKRVAKLSRRLGRRDGVPARVILFSDIPLAATVKLAFLTLPGRSQPKRVSLDRLGEALFMLDDLCGRGSTIPSGADASTSEGQRALVYYVFVVGLAHYLDIPSNAIARTFDIYLANHTDVPIRASLDLPAIVQRATGLQPERYWGIVFAFLAPFVAITPENAHSATASIKRSQFLAAYDFTREETDSFFALVAQPVETIQEDVKRFYTPDNLRPFHLIPLAKAPLAIEDDVAYCPLPRLLLQKLTDGLYHLLLNACVDSDRGRFQSHIGDRFQAYVDRLLARVYGRAGQYIDGAALDSALAQVPSRESSKRCDGLIVVGDSLVLVETKAQFFAAEARAGENADAFFDRLGEIVVDGTRQIDATIQHVRNGHFVGLGVDPGKIKTFYPLIVSFQALPMRPEIYAYVVERLVENSVLTEEGVRPPQFFDACDVELLEIALQEGASLKEVLDAKLGDLWSRGNSFVTYVRVRGTPRISSEHNPYLSKIYHRLVETTAHYLKSRARDDTSGTSSGAE